MNELVPKADAGPKTGSGVASPVAPSPVQKPAGNVAAGNVVAPPLPSVPIGKPGYQFKFPVESPQGQDERREHERLRKADKRAAIRAAEPLPLPTPPMVDTFQAPAGEPGLGATDSPGAMVAEPFVPWLAADVADFTDELVELTEAKRVAEFVAIARDAKMPVKFIAEVERTSGYPVKSKPQLKRCLAECAAKWLNKTGVSSKNKEEVKLLFCMVTIKLQGVRLKRDLVAMIEEDRAKRAPVEPKTETPAPSPQLSLVQ